MLRWPNGTQQKDFLYAQRFVHFEKPDAVRGRADAERRAVLAYLLGCGLPRMWPNWAEMVLRKPHARKTHLLGVGNLLQGFMDALGFALWGPRFGHLNEVFQSALAPDKLVVLELCCAA
jgi:hypothetical protein